MRARPAQLLALALLLAALLAAGGRTLAIVEQRVALGATLELALWRASAHTFTALLHASAAAIATVALAAAGARRGAGPALSSASFALGAALCWSALAHWPFQSIADSHRQVGTSLLLAVALCAATFAALRAPRLLRGRAGLALGVAALAAVPIGIASALRLRPLRVQFREVVREVATARMSWRALEGHPLAAPDAQVFCPSEVARAEGGDLVTLAMPPPARVELAVREEEGAVLLRGSAGIDASAYEAFDGEGEALALRFEIAVDGELRFAHEEQLRPAPAVGMRRWTPIAEGLSLAPGARVELRTALIGAADAREHAPVAAGFGALVLERVLEKGRTRASPEAPSILLIVMDTLRQDRLSCYGYQGARTPALDSLAARGIRFENAYATSSWTWPSTASILTGLPPESHGVESERACYLRAELDSLPKLLARRGLLTAAFSCNPLIVAEKGFAGGFQEFDDAGRFRRSDLVIDDPLEWLEHAAGARFFLYVHLVDTHAPYVPLHELRLELERERPRDFPFGALARYAVRVVAGEGLDAEGRALPGAVVPPEHLRWMNRLYDASVETADHYVGRLLERLRALGLEESTIVAFTSDHGEEFLDHGLLTHGNTVHRELVATPLLLAGPSIPAGRSVPTAVSNRHLAPTLAKFGGARFARLDDAIDLSLVERIPERPVFFSTHLGWWNGRHRIEVAGVRSGDWELHWAPEGAAFGAREPAPEGDWKLYHLPSDPAQQRDLAREEPERARELLVLLRARRAALLEARDFEVLGAGRQALQLLRGIGYLGGDR